MIRKELKVRQICFFIIALFPVSKFFMMGSVLATYSNEDMWISALINLCLDFIPISVCLFLTNKTGKNLFELLESSFPKPIYKGILILYALFFFIKSILPIHEVKDYIRLTLYITSPVTINFLPFFALAFYICLKKIRVLGRISDLLFFITVLGYITLLILTLKNVDFLAILPIGANGFENILKGSYHSLNWFGDGVYLLFLTGEYAKSKKCNFKIIISYVISSVMILLFTIIFYGTFLSIAKNQPFAMTETVKYDSVINNTERFDYVGIILILFSNIFSLALPLFFATKILDKVFNFKKNYISPVITVLLSFIIVYFFDSFFASIEYFILNYFSAFTIAMAFVLPVIILIVCSIKGDKNESY